MALQKKPKTAVKAGPLAGKSTGGAGKSSLPGPDALRQEIESRAYDLYLARAGESADAEADWQQAERDVRRKYGLD